MYWRRKPIARPFQFLLHDRLLCHLLCCICHVIAHQALSFSLTLMSWIESSENRQRIMCVRVPKEAKKNRMMWTSEIELARIFGICISPIKYWWRSLSFNLKGLLERKRIFMDRKKRRKKRTKPGNHFGCMNLMSSKYFGLKCF